MNSGMMALVKQTELPFITEAGPVDPRIRLKLMHDYLNYLRNYNAGSSMQSDGEISAGLTEIINNSDCDIVNLHWISYMLSIEDISNLNKPLVWTFHDMWPLCGNEHYVDNDTLQTYL